MPALLTLLLLIVAGVMFALAACSVPTGRLNTIGAGLLCVTIAVWLGPALAAL